jgi:hypothetical protein
VITKRLQAFCLCFFFCTAVYAAPTMVLPVTPFSNMENGYQATNPGFRVILKTQSGVFIAGAPLTMDAVINGTSDDASEGTAYGKLNLNITLPDPSPALGMLMDGAYTGTLSICMAQDSTVPMESTVCQDLGSSSDGRPFQWLNKSVSFTVAQGNVQITQYVGDTGDGGTAQQISLSTFHPAFGFAAPGKAFKDYQSPLVFDLNNDGKLNLVNVWNDKKPIFFDLNGSGQKVRTGWVDGADGILFVDNGSGCAQNGSQFFGEYTKSQNGKKTFKNGFDALAQTYHLKADGKVVMAEHPELKIWRNTAQDGICKLSEVFPASRFIKEMPLSFEQVKDVKLTADNEIRLIGNYLGQDGKKHLVGDVWFKQRRNPNAYVALR